MPLETQHKTPEWTVGTFAMLRTKGDDDRGQSLCCHQTLGDAALSTTVQISRSSLSHTVSAKSKKNRMKVRSYKLFFIRHQGEGLQCVPQEALGGFQDREGRLDICPAICSRYRTKKGSKAREVCAQSFSIQGERHSSLMLMSRALEASSSSPSRAAAASDTVRSKSDRCLQYRSSVGGRRNL